MKKSKQIVKRGILHLSKETMQHMVLGADGTVGASQACTYSTPGPSYTFYSYGAQVTCVSYVTCQEK